MKRYVDHLSRELFRYALTVTVLLFLLFTVGLGVNFQLSTGEVLKDGAARLSAYWGDSIAEIESGVAALAENGGAARRVLEADAIGAVTRKADAYAQLYDEANTWADGSSFAVTDGDGRIVASNIYREDQELISDPAVLASLWAAVTASDDGVARQALQVHLTPPHAGVYATATAIPHADARWDGAMMIGVLGERGLIDQIHAQSIERIVVTDRFDNMLLDTVGTGLEPSVERSSSKFIRTVPNLLTLTANGVDYFHASADEPTTGVAITVLTPQRFFWKFVSTSFVILGIAAVVMVVLAKVMTGRQSRRSAQALASLDHGIEEWFRGNMEYRLATPAYREFGGIYDSFNGLIGQLDVQVKDNIALEQSHTALELRQLETQFNPHFVFNTLEILRYEIAASPEVAARIVLDLASLMRYSIRDRGNPVRLGEDIEYLRSFLDLHTLRPGESMRYRVDCDAEAHEALFPRLLIQPLVENALAHAAPEPGEPLKIRVSAQVDDDILTVVVADNGAPIPASVLRDIRASLDADEPPAQHLGVFLVNRVITLIYGRYGGYGLQIESDASGTRAAVRIPYEV